MRRKVNPEHYLLQQTILHHCQFGRGTVWQKYEDCKKLLRDAEKRKVIAGSDWNEWMVLVKAALGI